MIVVVAVVVVAVGSFLTIWKRSYSARLPQFLNLTTSKTQQFCETSSIVWTWQRQKRSNSARLPQFSKLTTSKTKQFCVTSFKNKSLVQSWRPRANAFCDFSTPPVESTAPATKKVMPGHMKCCTCHAKSSQQTWKSDPPKCNPSQEISARTPQQLWWTCLL